MEVYIGLCWFVVILFLRMSRKNKVSKYTYEGGCSFYVSEPFINLQTVHAQLTYFGSQKLRISFGSEKVLYVIHIISFGIAPLKVINKNLQIMTVGSRQPDAVSVHWL